MGGKPNGRYAAIAKTVFKPFTAGAAPAISAIICSIVYAIISMILVFIPVVGWIPMLLIGPASFIFLIFCIMGIINAVKGRMKPLPIIGKFVIIK